MAENKKIYILDMYSLLLNPDATKEFGEHDVVVPISVIQELGKHVRNKTGARFAAKLALKSIRSMRKETNLCNWTKINGEGSGNFKIKKHQRSTVQQIDTEIGEPAPLEHRILSVVKDMVSEIAKERRKCDVILVTNDDDLFIKADSMGMHVEEFKAGRVKAKDEGYMGYTVIPRSIPAAAASQLHGATKSCAPKHLPKLEKIANHYYVFGSKEKHVIVRYDAVAGLFRLVPNFRKTEGKIFPKNIGQECLWDALICPDIKLVTIKGEAGTGKSIVAFATALELISDSRTGFKKIFFSKQIISLNDKDMGFLPGTAEEKLAPYIESMEDSLAVIAEKDATGKVGKSIEALKKSQHLKAIPLAFIRGTSKRNLYYIVDECQNLAPLEIKTIMTRLGTNCKLVLCGDISQIDVDYLDKENNGLAYTIENAKGRPLVAHFTLVDGERGELTELANEIF